MSASISACELPVGFSWLAPLPRKPAPCGRLCLSSWSCSAGAEAAPSIRILLCPVYWRHLCPCGLACSLTPMALLSSPRLLFQSCPTEVHREWLPSAQRCRCHSCLGLLVSLGLLITLVGQNTALAAHRCLHCMSRVPCLTGAIAPVPSQARSLLWCGTSQLFPPLPMRNPRGAS